ncbi:hypothetical protein EDD15DRAFT_2294870 [Pisolithus albus]|nr:hypothetical protein EDD15DRAFT_2294870 [Pisolithus albus]
MCYVWTSLKEVLPYHFLTSFISVAGADAYVYSDLSIKKSSNTLRNVAAEFFDGRIEQLVSRPIIRFPVTKSHVLFRVS